MRSDNMKDNIVFGSCATICAICGITQTSEVFRLIQVILGVIASVFAIAYTIWKWYRKATREDSKGGKKITKDEVDELFEDINRTIEIKEEDENDRD